MKETFSNKRIIYKESLDSTNSFLKKLAQDGAEDGTIVIAGEQSAGRGRRGNSFVSEAGGLYFSFLMRTKGLAVENVTTVTTKTAVAVLKTLKKAAGVNAGIKWVNDIVLNSKKVCGILVEAGTIAEGGIPYVVIGIGINVNQNEFPDGISAVASSLRIETGRIINMDNLIGELVDQLDFLRNHLTDRDDDYLKEYRRACITTGREIVFERESRMNQCRAEKIEDDYGLTVAYQDGSIETLRSGEVHVRGIEGYV